MITRPLASFVVLLAAAACEGEGSGPDSGAVPDTGTAVDGHTGVDAPVDAPGADATSRCADVAGTYEVTWRPGAGNAAECEAPLATIEIAADGLDVLTEVDTCTSPGCVPGNCDRSPLDATCEASISVSGPCAGLVAGRTITSTYRYGGTTAAFLHSDSMSPAGACSFEGTARRM